MNSIQIEKTISQNYGLLMDIYHPDLLALTVNNVARVEAMIDTDSNYWRSGDVQQTPEFEYYQKQYSNHRKDSIKSIKYKGSTAYWMQELKLCLDSAINPIKQMLPFIPAFKNLVEEWEKLFVAMILTPRQNISYRLALTIYGAVSAIDRENSTHLTSDAKNNNFGNGRIELTKRIFQMSHSLLDRLKNRDIKIIEKLSKKTKNGTKGGRENYSFATKFCHYACYYWFEGLAEQDNY